MERRARGRTRPLVRLQPAAWWCLALVVVALACPSVACAHAALVGTTPAGESTSDTHPSQVEITFSENVVTIFGGTKVYAPDGSRADRGEARANGEVVTVPVDTTEPGTYAVSWRVTSADGHPVRGAFVFHVEQRSEDAVSRDKAREASEGSRSAEIAFGVARGGILLGVLGAAGAIAFCVLVDPRWRPRWLRAMLLLAFVSMVASYLLDVSVATGRSLVESMELEVLRDQATTVYGRATLVRIVLAALSLGAASLLVLREQQWARRTVRIGVLVLFGALTASLSLSGHAVGEDVSVLRLPLDMLHGMAAAAWLGGLLQLLAYARQPQVDVAAVQRFSRLALVSVVVLVVTGLYGAWQEVGLSWDGLVDTTYGRLLIGKSLLLLATIPLANANRRRTVPALAAGDGTAPARLHSIVRGELVLLVIVIALTAWLIQSVPARNELRPGFVEKTLPLRKGGSVQLVIDPAQVGGNEIHVYAFDPQQVPDDAVTDISLTATNPERGLGPLKLDLDLGGPGHYTTSSATIPFAGRWEFVASVRRGEFEEETARFSADIATRQPD